MEGERVICVLSQSTTLSDDDNWIEEESTPVRVRTHQWRYKN